MKRREEFTIMRYMTVSILLIISICIIPVGKVYADNYEDNNSKISSGMAADITSSKVNVNEKLNREGYVEYDTYNKTYKQTDYGAIYCISDFFDNNGVYTISYSGKKYVYISRIDSNLKITKTIKIKKKYPEVGGVVCDNLGNYYIAYGQYDEKGYGGIAVFAVSKYSHDGAYIDSSVYKAMKYTCYYCAISSFETKEPFRFGNCAMEFQGDTLVCSYARKMLNGHQSNGVYCVDTKTMKEVDTYDSYVSHSFNESVVPLKNENVVFVDHGDAYPRGISIKCDGKEYVPFHFYGKCGDNTTYATLGGAGEVSTGCAVVGSSSKSMNVNATKENKQVFLQIINPATGESVIKGSSRTGTSCGENVTDTGIKWITNYNDGSYATYVNMVVIPNDRIFIAWERYSKNNEFINSYYVIVSSSGEVLQKSTPMQLMHLSGCEEIKYSKGYIYWTYADGKSKVATINKLKLNSIVKKKICNVSIITSSDKYVYTAKSIKPTVTVKYGIVKLKSGRDYIVSYKNNKNIGTAKIIIKGKGKYTGTVSKSFTIVPGEVKNLINNFWNSSKDEFKWSKTKGATGYQIKIFNCNTQTEKYKYTKLTHFSQPAISGRYSAMYYIRAYKKVNGKKIYGKWSKSDFYWDTTF